MTRPSPQQRLTQQRLAGQLADIGFALPGTISLRQMRCGKRRCRCKADPPALHGPYIQWTRTVDGKTVTKLLTAEQLERYQPWLDNARKLRDLVSQLEALPATPPRRRMGGETLIKKCGRRDLYRRSRAHSRLPRR